MRFVHCIARFISLAFFALIFPIPTYPQDVNITNFYYRDYLDFGQNKGVFKEGNKITGKDGQTLTIPNIPNFQASSNNGSLTAVGRGFAVTALHVTSPEKRESSVEFRRWGLELYTIAKMDVDSSDEA